MNEGAFGVVVDGEEEPRALFAELADAIVWALDRFGSDRFSIRWFDRAQMLRLPRVRGAA
jgi:hypothetical protein